MYNRPFTPERITELKPDEIFVFGSNLAGAHAGGAARIAHEKFGAVWGQGVELQGQSYAIPTMQGGVETIRPYVDRFLNYADNHPNYTFLVTRIGCGIAGFTAEQIAPLFHDALEISNILLPEDFVRIIDAEYEHFLDSFDHDADRNMDMRLSMTEEEPVACLYGPPPVGSTITKQWNIGDWFKNIFCKNLH